MAGIAISLQDGGFTPESEKFKVATQLVWNNPTYDVMKFVSCYKSHIVHRNIRAEMSAN